MSGTRKLSPKRAADELLTLMRDNANEKRAASYQRFFKEPVEWFGVENKLMTRFLGELIEKVEGAWTIDDAVRFCNLMVKHPQMEPRGTGFQTVAHFVPTASPELLSDVHRWLEKSCGNWGLVDNLASSVLAPLLDLHPSLIPEVVGWTDSPSMWLRRAAAVAFVPLVPRRKKHLTTAYRIATRLLGDQEDLMHKAVGWLLREAGKVDSGRLETFLLKHRSKIPRTTVRYALERFSKEDRKRLMAATK